MLAQVVIFLADAIVSFMATLFLLRFAMQACRVSFVGPLGKFVIPLTNWAVMPLRRWIPGIKGYDWASVFAAFIFELLLAVIILGVQGGVLGASAGTLLLMVTWFAVRNLLRAVVYMYIGAMILMAVLSWVNPFSPLSAPAYQLTRPLLDPIRRLIPRFSGIDLSPLVAILLLQVVLMFL